MPTFWPHIISELGGVYYHHQQAHELAGDISSDGDLSIVSSNTFKGTVKLRDVYLKAVYFKALL